MPGTPTPFARRKSSASPFAARPRQNPGVQKAQKAQKGDTAERLPDTGLTPSLAPPGEAQDVLSLISYVQNHAWEDIPERAAGMGSERISEVLRFRAALPPVVSLAHLHALSVSITNTERELARLVARAVVRRIKIPGRGKGGAAVGEGVVVVGEWKERVRRGEGLEDRVKEKYVQLMDATPMSSTTSTASLTAEEVRQLVSAGFLTSPTTLTSAKERGNLFSAPGTASLLGISTAGTTASTGTLAAVGGRGAIHDSGGGGSMLATSETRTTPQIGNKLAQDMTFSLPSTGAYLKLLTEARRHLVHLLKQLSPRCKEATMETLKERWEGNTLNDERSKAKRARGEWTGVLPGRTKKWKEFWGLEFDWVLAECVGSGVVEIFETGVGVWGVRGR
jgi:hypothetical protein